MEYVYGTEGRMEILKTKGSSHTDLTGFHQVEQIYPDQTITDNFRVVQKLRSAEDAEGNCYDWYEIDKHYRVIDKTPPVIEQVDEIRGTASIVFVTMAEGGQIDTATAGEHAETFAEWAYPVAYKAGNIRRFEGLLYSCISDHTSQADWTPAAVASLWKRIADPSEEWPQWSRPIGAHDAYDAGDKVSHNGQHWISDIGGNVWEPGVYGWSQAQE